MSTDIEDKVSDLEVKLNTISVSIGAHLRDEQSMEETLRHIDDTVNTIKVDMVSSKYDTHMELEKALTPVYRLIRTNETKVEEAISRTVRDYIGSLAGILMMIFALSGYIYKSDKNLNVTQHEAIIQAANKHINKFEKIHPQGKGGSN